MKGVTLSRYERYWRASLHGRIKAFCTRQRDGWHQIALMDDGQLVDKGPCSHNHGLDDFEDCLPPKH